MGRRNTFLKFTRRSLKTQSLSWALICRSPGVDKAFDRNRSGIDLKLMPNPRRAAILCAFVGLILAGASYLYVTSLYDCDEFKGPPHLLAISWILCPAQLFLAWDGPIMCFLIGVLNTSLYALVGFWIATVRKKKPDNSLRIQ
jgi:hypothetical protein